jgi:hypothetical protein
MYALLKRQYSPHVENILSRSEEVCWMDFEDWFSRTIREAAAIITIFFFGILLTVSLLRHWFPTGLLYLYLWDLCHQILFYIGGIMALVEWLMIKYMETPIEKRVFTGIVLILLFVASFQAWIDEHRNSEQLIQEKADIFEERDFWKGQSYSKDETIRLQGGLLSQDSTNAGQLQKNYDQLVAKMLDLTKPEHVRLSYFVLPPRQHDPIPNLSPGVTADFIVVTDRVITPIKLEVTCNLPIILASGAPMGSNLFTSINWGGVMGVYKYGIGLGSPAWAPASPMLVTVHSMQRGELRCSFDEL